MAKLTISQVAYLSQELTHRLQGVHHFTVKASAELEQARRTLEELLMTYDRWFTEDKHEYPRQ